MTSWWKRSQWLFFGLFLIGAAVQFNDPDPWRWAAVYALAATSCVLHGLGRPVWRLPALLLAVAVVWSALLLPEVLGQTTWGEMTEAWTMRHDLPNSDNTEMGREMGGLILIFAWMIPQVVVGRRAQRSSPN
jgi:hypothetical protein